MNIEDHGQSLIESLRALREDKEHLETKVSVLQAALDKANVEIELQARRLTDLQARHDYYQRYTTELVTEIDILCDIFEKVKVQAKQSAYRPNGAVPKETVRFKPDVNPPKKAENAMVEALSQRDDNLRAVAEALEQSGELDGR